MAQQFWTSLNASRNLARRVNGRIARRGTAAGIASLAMVLWHSQTASAHPGHGTTSAGSLTHYVAEPWHAATLILGALVAMAVVALAIRQRHAKARVC